jgi:glycosyltransferase involved in cell wall biosynthesis
MTVGIDCRLLDKYRNTGISRYTEFLVEYYTTRYGTENVFLITNNKKFKYSNCNVIYTKLKPFNIFHFLFFSSFVNNLNLNLLHVPFYSALFFKNTGIKVIVTVHDLMYKFVADFFSKFKYINQVKILYFDFIVMNSLLNADIIVSVSETTRNDIYNIFGFKSMHISESSEIKGEIDLSILQKFNLKYKYFYFYCGNNRSHKNVDFIVDIFKNNNNLPPLVLAGKGHNNCNNVIATGIVSEEELKALYISSIAFVFPSKYEGFGLPVLESLLSKTPVIASNISAFLEFNSPNIFYFSLDSKDEFLDALARASLHIFNTDEVNLARYSKDKIYELYDKFLDELTL